jgi:hypothetical protein
VGASGGGNGLVVTLLFRIHLLGPLHLVGESENESPRAGRRPCLRAKNANIQRKTGRNLASVLAKRYNFGITSPYN